MILVGGHDEAVAEWAGKRLGVKFVQPLSAFGIVDKDGNAVGAAIFSDFYAGGNIEWTHVGKGTLQRSVIRELVRYAFETCNVSRVTSKTARRNLVVKRLLPKAGFLFECVQQRYFGPTKEDDAIVYALFRDQAERWLRKV